MTCADCGALVPDDYHDHDLERFCPGCCPKCRHEAIAYQVTAAHTYRVARMAVEVADTREVVVHVQRQAAAHSQMARRVVGVTA